MALADIWAMSGGRNNSVNFELGLTPDRTINNYTRGRTTVMEYKSDWKKHRKLSALTAQVICSATPFMPWYCKIPISDGYHEFL